MSALTKRYGDTLLESLQDSAGSGLRPDLRRSTGPRARGSDSGPSSASKIAAPSLRQLAGRRLSPAIAFPVEGPRALRLQFSLFVSVFFVMSDDKQGEMWRRS